LLKNLIKYIQVKCIENSIKSIQEIHIENSMEKYSYSYINITFS